MKYRALCTERGGVKCDYIKLQPESSKRYKKVQNIIRKRKYLENQEYESTYKIYMT